MPYFYNDTVHMISCNLEEYPIEMGGHSVKDAIGDQYQMWHSKEPVLIDAPTGTGKTTFIYDTIILSAIENKQHVLLVSNRIALSSQQKRRILEIVRERAPKSVESIVEESIEDKINIDSLNYFGPVCVATYQGIHNLLNGFDPYNIEIINWFQRLRYVVFDEIHFLYSDALFYPYCGVLLQKLPWVFQKAVRIYMTATSWEIKDLIFDAEKSVIDTRINIMTQKEMLLANQIPGSLGIAYTPKTKRKFYYYHMKADYSAYRLHFFHDALYCPPVEGKNPAQKSTRKKYLLALIDQMNPPPTDHNKWLVFVDKKSSGLFLQNALEAKGIKTAYMDSTIKKPRSAWKELIEESKVKTDVLCATPVIECGVNVVDDTVKHVAILSTDRTTFIQLLGRKRRKPDETVDLWVWLPEQEYFRSTEKKISWYLNIADQLIAVQETRNYKCDTYIRIAKELWGMRKKLTYDSLFYIDNQGRFSVDLYVFYVLCKRYKYIKELANSNNPELFKEHVEGWLGIPAIEVEAKPSEYIELTKGDYADEIEDVTKFLSRRSGKKISEEKFREVRSKIVDLAEAMDVERVRKDRRDTLSAKSLNRLLEKMGIAYVITKNEKMWTISRCK